MNLEQTSPCHDVYIAQSLILSNETTFQLLVPFGKVKNRTITTPNSSLLSYYRYSWSPELQIFTSNSDQLAWLYLTLIYGMFNININGFHVAIFLLTTHSYPTQTFTEQTVGVLQNIAKLSPERTFYPPEKRIMEQIKLPEGLTPVTSSDIYWLIVNNVYGIENQQESPFLHYKAFVNSLHLLPELGDRILKEISQPSVHTHIGITVEQHAFTINVPNLKVFSLFKIMQGISDEFQDFLQSTINSFDWESSLFDQSNALNLFDMFFRMTTDQLYIFKYSLFLQLTSDFLNDNFFSPPLANVLYHLLVTSNTSPPLNWNPPLEEKLPYVPPEIMSARFRLRVFGYPCDIPYNHCYRAAEDQVMTYHQSLTNAFDQVKSMLCVTNYSIPFKKLSSTTSFLTTRVDSFPQTVLPTSNSWNLLVLNTWSLLKLKPFDCYDQLATSLARILGFTIRPQQFKIANHLLHSKTSIQTQLFMGEGKTSVIVPLICLGILSDPKKTVPRVTILKPLYNTCLNKYQTLFSCLGLRLGRFVCQRSDSYDANHYNSIITDCDLLITTAEYRQSFILKTKTDNSLASVSLENVHDILDESDEILDPRSQLIYPYGQPQVLDGGRLRWVIGEAILQSMKHFFEFPFEHELYISDCKLDILTYILDGNTSLEDQDRLDLKPSTKSLIIDYALGDSHDFSIFSDRIRTVALILRGYFYYSVLERALKLRYRVNYGRDVKRKSLLAVPFRAKDVPALASEFSDVDLAIFLTLLTWHQTGLDHRQFSTVLNSLQSSHEHMLSIWTDGEFSFDNLVFEDDGLILRLHDQLGNDPRVIDFYLNLKCFPTYTKQFPTKRSTSPWDLANPGSLKPVVGFSGTNGSQRLLPYPTTQQDLKFVEDTNRNMDLAILDQQILKYDGDLLKVLIENPSFTVLLDVGAVCMLQNKEFASEWLSKYKQHHPDSIISAVLYFENDKLLASNGDVSLNFHDSIYVEQMDKCLVYLDDFHCRGVDLKFPPRTRAALTLYKGLTRDKIAQGSMRMRKLLMNSPEKHCITYLQPPSVQFLNILDWCLENSSSYVERSLKTWTREGITWFNDLPEADAQTLCDLYHAEILPCPPLKLLEKSTISSNADVYTFIHNTLSSSNVLVESNIEEEQEKELEEELQEERSVQRPAPAVPRIPSLGPALKALVRGAFFANFFIQFEYENNVKFYCTEEFAHIKKYFPKDFSRRPSWVIVHSSGVLFVSPFEANELLVLSKLDAQKALTSLGLCSVVSRVSSPTQLIFPFFSPSESLSSCPVFNLYLASWYFHSGLAVKDFCSFFGLFPRPRTSEQETARERGLIDDDGWGSVDGKLGMVTVSPLSFMKNRLETLHHDDVYIGSHLHDVLYLMRNPQQMSSSQSVVG
ncbi:hypothetical protein GEMRC1_005628 [Eukaryota sp. GEM-RC1]